MLIIFRRHMKRCKEGQRKGRKLRDCNCPLAVEGRLRGRMVRQSLDIRSWEAAQKIVREWEAEGQKEVMTVDAAGERFLADMRSRSLSQETIKKFDRLLESLKGKFGGVLISDIMADDLAKFREGWKASPITARKMLERLRSFFRFSVDRGWIERNPALSLKAPKDVQIAVKPYEKAELEKIAWALDLFPDKGIYGEQNKKRVRGFVTVLRWTGLRIRDVVQLKRSQVVGDSIVLRTHKNQKPVKILMHPEVKEVLQENTNVGDYFFWSGLGEPKSCVGDWQRSLRRLSEIAGVHLHAHRWRHTFATDLLSKGVPVSEVAAILGNSPAIVEKHYSQWIQSRQDRLNEAIKATWM
jgi:integrase